jgi:hypothetical protein
MNALRTFFPALILALTAALPLDAARNTRRDQEVANQHLSAIVMIERFAQAIYAFEPGADAGCTPEFGKWMDNGDGTFTQVNVSADCTRTVNTNFGGVADDFAQEITFSNGIRESVRARPIERFNEGPGRTQVSHAFSTGDRVDYEIELQQEPALDEFGEPIPGLNFFYALVRRGTVRLRGGQVIEFELRQTKAFDCFNFFNGTELPPDVCNEWFVFNEKFGVLVPRQDRLNAVLRAGRLRGTLELNFPIIDPAIDAIDFSQPTTGTMSLYGRELEVELTSTNLKVPGWNQWRSFAPGYEGIFELGQRFSGRGQAFRVRSGAGAAGRRRRQLEFAARWDERGIGTVIFGNGQTRPAGPTGGLLEFGSLRWSGLAAAFGPSPGL